MGGKAKPTVKRLWLDSPLWAKGLVVAALPLLWSTITTALLFQLDSLRVEANERVRHTYQVKLQLDDVGTLVNKALRLSSFPIHANDADTTWQFQSAVNRARSLLAGVGVIVSADQTARFLDLQVQVDSLLVDLDRLAANPPPAELVKLRLPEYEVRAGQIDQMIERMKEHEALLLAERIASVERLRERTQISFWLMLALVLAGSGLSLWLFLGGIAARIHALNSRFSEIRLAENSEPLHLGADEVGQLGETLNQFHAQLAARERALLSARAAAEKARTEAEAANQAKSEFLSRMSHELRTPLNAILGFAQLLEMEAQNQTQREGLQYILRGGRHLLSLINEVLDIARIETGKLSLSIEPTAVDIVLLESMELVRAMSAEKGVKLHFQPDLAGAMVMVDPLRLKQVLVNLLSNAIKYNRIGGRVDIRATKMEPNLLRIEVTDTGFGLSAEQQKRLFTPFDRLGAESGNVEGTGIGLALARGLVQAMNGVMGVSSVVGEGTTVWFTLVTAASGAALEPQEFDLELQFGNPGVRTISILCVEDNQPNLALLQRLFSANTGVKLICVESGADAIQVLTEVTPDLILLDLHLPDMSGIQVLQAVRARDETHRIPVIVLSADASPAQVDRLRYEGASRYLTKPLDLKALVVSIQGLLTGGISDAAQTRKCPHSHC